MTKDNRTSPGSDHCQLASLNNHHSVKHEQDIQEFVESTMNELLGWYGYDRLTSRHGYELAARYRSNASPVIGSPGQQQQDTPDGQDHQASSCCTGDADRPTVDERCTSPAASSKRRCDWCKQTGNCPTCIDPLDCTGSDPDHKSRGLAFCDDICLSRYKMNIFCTETQQHLQQMQQKPTSDVATVCSGTTPSSGADTSSNSECSKFLVTPELWMTSSCPSDVKKRPAGESWLSDDSEEHSRKRVKHRLMTSPLSNTASPVTEGQGQNDDRSRFSDDVSVQDVTSDVDVKPNSNNSGRRSTASSNGGKAASTSAAVSVWNASSTTAAATTSSMKTQPTTSRAHYKTSSHDERRHRQRSPARPSAKLTRSDSRMTSSSASSERNPKPEVATTSSSSQKPLFAPWLLGQLGHQTSQQFAHPGTDPFLMPPPPPSTTTATAPHLNGLWPTHLPSTFAAAAATHQSLLNLAAAAAASASSPPLGLNSTSLPPTVRPSLPMPTPSNLFMPSAFLQSHLFPAQSNLPSAGQNAAPFMLPSSMSRTAADGSLPPNTLIVPYPIPLPLPVPIPIPIPVPFDSRLLAKARSNDVTTESQRMSRPEEARKSVSSSPRSSLASQLLGDVTWSRYAHLRSSPEAKLSSPPNGSSLLHASSSPQQTSALDFSTSSRTAADAEKRGHDDDVISPADDRQSVSSDVAARWPVKLEPVERSVTGSSPVASSALPPLPYSARRSLILDAPPPQPSGTSRDTTTARENGLADRRSYSGSVNVTARKSINKKRSNQSSNGARVAVEETGSVEIALGTH